MSRKRTMAVLPLVACLSGCADDTFAVVSVLTHSGSLDGVAQLRVHVTSNAAQDVLSYPAQGSGPLHIDSTRPVTFSVQFKDWSGQATFEVEPTASDGTPLAYGKTHAVVSKHDVSPIVVKVFPGATRPEHPRGGAMADDPLSCAPDAPSDACGPEHACGILCTPASVPVSMCYPAGFGRPGDSCERNQDCAAGSQCLTFSAPGCSVATCVRFCNSDSACDDANAFCNLPIPCGTGTFFACSRPCDPTATSNNGCATGLGCFVYSGDTTDCACPGPGGAGASCMQNAGCAAGLSCVIPSGTDAGVGTGVCRPVCKLDTPTCPSGTVCHAFDHSSRRLYGFCQ